MATPDHVRGITEMVKRNCRSYLGMGNISRNKPCQKKAPGNRGRKGGNMIDLENGYVIVQTSANNFSLKQKYMGMRKGVETECLRLISHHGSVEDAIQSVSGLLQGCSGNEQRETLEQFVNRIESANTRLAESVSNSLMQRFYIYTPKAIGVSTDPHPIVNLIPVGRDNAISRKELLRACVTAGLVKSKQNDRAMRELIKKARMDYVILNLSNGKGYYRLDSGGIL